MRLARGHRAPARGLAECRTQKGVGPGMRCAGAGPAREATRCEAAAHRVCVAAGFEKEFFVVLDFADIHGAELLEVHAKFMWALHCSGTFR